MSKDRVMTCSPKKKSTSDPMLLHDFTFFVAVCKQKSKEHERSLLVKQIDLDCLVFILNYFDDYFLFLIITSSLMCSTF